VATVRVFEGKKELVCATLVLLQRALESASVAFIDENGGGPGVRLRKRHHERH
jgi:hypothetical protein